MTRQPNWRQEFASPMKVIQSELNRIFDEYWTPSRTGVPASTRPVDVEPTTWSPAVDLVETADAYLLTTDLPGVDPATIELSVTGHVLTIRGTKPSDSEHASGFLLERRFGPFHRQIVLNADVNFEAAQAESRFGVLRVLIPKQRPEKPRTIPVGVG